MLSDSTLKRVWAPRCRGPWAKITLHGGGQVQFRPAAIEAVKAMNSVFQRYNYRTRSRDTGAFNCRKSKGASGGWSMHAYGTAFDINWGTNLFSRRLVTDMPSSMVRNIVGIRTNNGKQVWNWGGYWSNKKDCLAGDTMVITKDGPVAIKELAGKTVQVLSTTDDPTDSGKTESEWVEAPFASYGLDKVYIITFERRGTVIQIACNGDHRWPISRKGGEIAFIKAADLKQALKQCDAVPALQYPIITFKKNNDFIAQGIVWGDGSVYNNHGNGRIPKTECELWHKKKQLIKYLEDFSEKVDYKEDSNHAWKMPSYLKSIPSNEETLDNKASFFAGWFATDGCMKGLIPSLSTSSPEALKWVKKEAPNLGLTITSVGTQKAGKSGFNSTKDNYQVNFRHIPLNFLLRDDHIDRWEVNDKIYFRWKIQDIAEGDQEEEVFCATVEGRNVFALATDSVPLLTGNSMHYYLVCSPGDLATGINWNTVNGAPAAKPAPPKPIDWKALRRYLAASLVDGIKKAPNMGPGHKGPGAYGADWHVGNIQKALNVVTGTKLPVNGIYDAWTAGVITNFQNFVKLVIKGPMPDPPGHFREYTRFYLVAALENIRDGKA